MDISEIIIASNNAHKVEEIKSILSGIRLYSLREKNICVDPEETGATFAENAYIKASEICRLSGLPCLADDSGLSVEALNGAPGVFSARYAGEEHSTPKNNALLLKNMEGVTDRRAKFVCALALCLPNGETVTAQGETFGEILTEARGSDGFGYDPLFFSYDLQKSFGEADAKEKNSVSHRGRALEILKSLLLL